MLPFGEPRYRCDHQFFANITINKLYGKLFQDETEIITSHIESGSNLINLKINRLFSMRDSKWAAVRRFPDRIRRSSPKTSLWTTESIIDFTHNRRVLASTFMSRRYKTVYLIRDILFWNLLIFSILQRPTLSRKADPVWSNPCLGTTMQEAIGSVRPMRAETFCCGASAASRNDVAVYWNVPREIYWNILKNKYPQTSPKSLSMPGVSSAVKIPLRVSPRLA